MALLFASFFIAGCAVTTGAGPFFESENSHWQGRLLLKVHSEPVQALSADFDLQGDARVGRLSLFTPLGTTAARLEWGAHGAQLQTAGQPQQFDSLDALTRHSTGTVLPIASLFEWLKGAEPVTPGWQVDLRGLVNGRFSAQRLPPDVPAELTIILDR